MLEKIIQWLKGVDILYYLTGFTIVLSFITMQYCVMFVEIPEANKEGFAHLRGMIDGAFVTGLVGHYFGTSKTTNQTLK